MASKLAGCVALASIAALFPAVSLLACLNESRPTVAQDISEAHLIRVTPADMWSAKKDELSARLAELSASVSFASDPDAQNDYAVTLIRLARAAEAIPVLEALERKWPGRYATAANLGAAYEHTSNNELAFKWVSEGLRRNPGSHAGTEWLHVRILEAKIARAKDADWLATHSIYDGGAPLTGSAAMPERARAFADSNGVPRTAKDVIEATAYQLNERMKFVRPPDPIVAELLFELASVVALEREFDLVMPVMKLAGEYKPVRAALFDERRIKFEALSQSLPRSVVSQATGDSREASWLWESVALLILSAIGFESFRRSRRKSDPKPA